MNHDLRAVTANETPPAEPLPEALQEVSAEATPLWIIALTRVRSVIGIVLASLYTVVMSVAVIIAGSFGFQGVVSQIMHLWAVGALKFFGIRMRIEGLEHLPSKGGGIIVFNHQSHFDIPALSSASWKTVRYGAKIELFKIPFFGPAIRASGSLPIARENRTEVFRVYREAEKRFAENFLFCLAPEGSRQKTAEIGRFKRGPFVFAINGQVPVIPAVIKGAHSILPKGSLWVNVGQLSSTIHVRFLPPVSTQGLAQEQATEITERVRGQMVAAYQAMPGDHEAS
jgi:1-acyl-sn-glycerol-3-phosphate acyltransferase